ncbi:hypothetical protein SUGI_0233590 [Cryptomeria japonica]|nr:hypothetical protein SUGI_0233590 [Cryptomeria japonica]
MDMLQAYGGVMQLAVDFVNEDLIPGLTLYNNIKEIRVFLVGGLFFYSDRQKKLAFYHVYIAFKRALYDLDKSIFAQAIAIHKQELAIQFCNKTMELFRAWVFLMQYVAHPLHDTNLTLVINR